MRVTAVSRECMDPARLSRMIFGLPNPIIPIIASRVYRIVHVKTINLSNVTRRYVISCVFGIPLWQHNGQMYLTLMRVHYPK